jgi:hypothetical protein
MQALVEQAFFVHPVLALELLEVMEEEVHRLRKLASTQVTKDFGLKRRNEPLSAEQRRAIRKLCIFDIEARERAWYGETIDARNKHAERIRKKMLLPSKPVIVQDIVKFSRQPLSELSNPDDVLRLGAQELKEEADELGI